MLYQLKNGKTIYLTVDEFLNLSLEEEQFLIIYGYGEVVNNPFRGSVIRHKSIEEDIEELDYDNEDISLDTTSYDIADDMLDFPDEFLDDGF